MTLSQLEKDFLAVGFVRFRELSQSIFILLPKFRFARRQLLRRLKQKPRYRAARPTSFASRRAICSSTMAWSIWSGGD